MIGRIVALAITGGATLGCLVVMIVSIGFQARHAFLWAIPAAIGAVLTLILRSTLPKSDPDDDP